MTTTNLYRLYGRDFAIVAEFPETEQGQADANAFMLANPGTGLLATDAGRVILAAMDDKGTPAPTPITDVADLNDETDHSNNIQVERIGSIDNGIDGKDEYLLLTNNTDDLTPEQAHNYLLPKIYRRATHPGSYFCTSVLAVQAAYSTNKVICTVQHRYDV